MWLKLGLYLLYTESKDYNLVLSPSYVWSLSTVLKINDLFYFVTSFTIDNLSFFYIFVFNYSLILVIKLFNSYYLSF